jgi:hypothetical protein
VSQGETRRARGRRDWLRASVSQKGAIVDSKL